MEYLNLVGTTLGDGRMEEYDISLPAPGPEASHEQLMDFAALAGLVAFHRGESSVYLLPGGVLDRALRAYAERWGVPLRERRFPQAGGG